ncbi:hypothetical protein ACSVDA_20570 [Cytobacillus sp. Hm23]
MITILILIVSVYKLLESAFGKKEYKFIKQGLENLDLSTSKICVISYTSQNFEKIDKILSTKMNQQYIIILFAPTWLVKLKKNNWDNHIVIDGNYNKWSMQLKSSDGYMLVKKKNAKFDRVYHLKEFFEDQYIKGV